MKKICENCNVNFIWNSKGSGRFCSLKCARGFSTKAKRKEINAKVSLKINEKLDAGEIVGWCKKIKNPIDSKICKQCGKNFQKPVYVKKSFCTLSCCMKFRALHRSPEQNLAISEGMKRAHREGRASTIGKFDRHLGQPSYPEKFFMKVIDNDFSDKQYLREMKIGKWFFDFAWPEKKKAIEIDGDQHLNNYRKIKDAEKDQFTSSQGWITLRIRWKDMYHKTQEMIEKAKKFIDN